MDNLGRNIRRERKALGLTLKRFADIIGTSKPTLQRIETGVKSPSVALLAEISHVLRKPIDTFIRDEAKGFYKLDATRTKKLVTKDFTMLTICPFGLIDRSIVVNHFRAKSGTFIKPHRNKGYEWIYIIRGGGIIEHNGISYPFKEGDVIYYDAKKIHSVKITKSLQSIDIFIRG